MKMARLKIYLAGPEVFLPYFGKSVFDAKKAQCAILGFEGVSPMDGEPVAEGMPPFAQGVGIYRANVAQMQRCDVVIANMTPFRGVSMDVGTAFEMGYMAANGKPVLAYSHDMQRFEDRSARYYEHGRPDLLESYSVGTSVERFDMADNLMMAGAVHCAGFRVHRVAVPAGEELTSVAGFVACLQELRETQAS